MEAFLTDTSVWIDFFNNRRNPQTEILTNVVEDGSVFFVCPIIIQEILQGIRSDSEFLSVKDKLLSIDILEIDAIEAAIGAAELYRKLRKKGITIKKSNDCLIAFYAIYFGVPLLHKDSDFDLISKYSVLKTVT